MDLKEAEMGFWMKFILCAFLIMDAVLVVLAVIKIRSA